MASRLQDVILRGTRSAQPAAATLAAGTLYFVTDEGVIERNSGSAWETFSGSGSSSFSSGFGFALSLIGNQEEPEMPMYIPGPKGDTGATGATGASGTGVSSIGPPGYDGEDGEPILIPGLVGPVGPAGSAGAGSWTTVFKTADESKANNNTRASDTQLKVTLIANTKYVIRGYLSVDAASGGGFFAEFNGPSSPTYFQMMKIGMDGNSATTLSTNIVKQDVIYQVDFSTGEDCSCWFQCVIHNGANAGDFTIDWAQATSFGTPTIMKAGSYMEYHQL